MYYILVAPKFYHEKLLMIFSCYFSVMNYKIVLRGHRWDCTFTRLSQESLELYRALGKSSMFNGVSSEISRKSKDYIWERKKAFS